MCPTWQSHELLIMKFLFYKGDRENRLIRSYVCHSLVCFNCIGCTLIKNYFGNIPVIRGSGENCVNTKEIKEATNQAMLQFVFPLECSIPFY